MNAVMTGSERRNIAVVMLCHFTAALAALGMPPFFAMILLQSFDSSQTHLVGWFYVLPTLCTALAAPWWGRFADRYGARRSLLRAQLGLALGFMLAALAPSPLFFALALVVQGLLGGTFAASSAYLASLVQGAGLAQSLNWMQGSARAALVVAPVLFGWLIGFVAPLQLYGYLAWLPLLAALVMLLALPAVPAPARSDTPGRAAAGDREPVSRGVLFALQFGFSFACVIGFPYFIADMQLRFAALGAVAVAWLFSLPHLVYLLLNHSLGTLLHRWPALRCLQLAFAVLALSYWGQYLTDSLVALIMLRLLMGLAMTACFVALHRLMSACSGRRAGGLFGRLDAAAKWAGVAAGLCAGALSGILGLSSPLLAAALVLLSLCLLLQCGFRKHCFIHAERN
ncbi:MFS transporter [Marinobacterium rhizophilum]|uniref:MFS transporter n=1 Tax=Marinobacterium rhizophilum TaxID=420402 RepID=A0ABY5HIL5_9GAMM|nr:MFS transporter [Marinobacterium rhizophilum]UTW10821.1 MFS transporter [Marinobacterium rhizophilum]